MTITEREQQALLYLQRADDDPNLDRWVSLVKIPLAVDFLHLNPVGDLPMLDDNYEQLLQGGEPPCYRHDLWSLSQSGRGYVEGVVTLDLGINPNLVALTQKGRDLIARGFAEVATPASAATEGGASMGIEGPAGRLRVFLCHASGDKEPVRMLYRRLRADGVQPWLDEEDLLPGQQWQREIPKQVRAADIVLVCLSKRSIAKTGYVQKEIATALDAAEERPEGTIYIIPARLEECEVPARLRDWQWVDLFSENGYDRLLRSLRVRADALVARDSGLDSGALPAASPSPTDRGTAAEGLRIEVAAGLGLSRSIGQSEPQLTITVINDASRPLAVPGFVELLLEDGREAALHNPANYAGLPPNHVLAEAERFTVRWPRAAWLRQRAEGTPAAVGVLVKDGRGRTYRETFPPELAAWFNTSPGDPPSVFALDPIVDSIDDQLPRPPEGRSAEGEVVAMAGGGGYQVGDFVVIVPTGRVAKVTAQGPGGLLVVALPDGPLAERFRLLPASDLRVATADEEADWWACRLAR